jgi:hypothetical protein
VPGEAHGSRTRAGEIPHASVMLRASYTMGHELDVVKSATCIWMSVIWVRTGGWQSDSFESCAASQRLARRRDQHPLDHDLCEGEPPGTEGLFVTRIGDRRWEIKSVWNLWRVSITDTMLQHAPGPSPHVGRQLATPHLVLFREPLFATSHLHILLSQIWTLSVSSTTRKPPSMPRT